MLCGSKYFFLPSEESPCGAEIRAVFKGSLLFQGLIRLSILYISSIPFDISIQKLVLVFYTALWLVTLSVFISFRVAFNVFTDG